MHPFHSVKLCFLFAVALLSVGRDPLKAASETILSSESSLNEASRKAETRVIGRLGFPKSFKFDEIKVTHSKLILLEEFIPSPVPTPKGFDQWDQPKRSEWFVQWEKTPAGKAYQRTEAARFSKLKKYEASVKKNSEFKFSKVEPGSYDFAGELKIEYQNKIFLSEFHARIKVSDVEEVSLDRVDLQLHRALQVGEAVPDFKIKSNRDVTINRNRLRKSHTLLVFWAAPSFDDGMIKKLSQFNRRNKFQVIAVGLGDRAVHDRMVKQSFAKHHCFANSLSTDVCRAFGVRGLPSFWLISPSGKVIAVAADFVDAQFDLEKVLNDRIRGNKF